MIVNHISGPIRGIVFDKDGTLFDFTATWGNWAAEVIAAETSDTPERRDALAKVLGFDLGTRTFHASSIVIASPARAIVEAALPHLKDTSVDVVLARWNDLAAKAPQVEAAPLKQVLGTFRRAGLKLGVATNDSEHPARAHLVAVGVDEIFDFIAGSDSGFGGKPDIGQLTAFCASTGLSPQDCLMVGDSTHDIDAGRAAGFTCVAVLTGVATRADLTPHADAVLTDIAELAAWLDQTTR